MNCDVLSGTALFLSIAVMLILLAAGGSLINVVLTYRLLHMIERFISR